MSINIALVGCGHWGRNLARNFAELGVLGAVCDGNAAAAQEQSVEYDVPVRSLDEILQDQAIDALAFATPARTHARLAHQALAAGKHVFVEKPLALDTNEARTVIDAAVGYDRTLMVGHLLHYHPLFRALKEQLATGRFGKLRRLSSTRFSLGKFRVEENVLWSFAPHDIAMLLALAERQPVDVRASGQSVLTPGIVDHASVELDFGDGLIGDIAVSWLQPVKQQRLVVIGEKAMAVFDDSVADWNRKLAIYDHQISTKEIVPSCEKAEAEYIEIERSQPLLEECRHFVECVIHGSKPTSDGEEGIAVLNVLETAQLSMDAGGKGDSHFAHPTAVIDDRALVGRDCKIWHFSHVLNGTVMGIGCTVGQNVMIGPDVRVGDRCKIQNNVSLYKGVTLGNDVFCGPSCVFTNVNSPRANIEKKDEFATTHVGDSATIGANATIVCGHDIGAFAFVGAGAVVTKDVPAFALVVGNPARQVGWVGHFGEALEEKDGKWVCPRTARHYRVEDGELLEIEQQSEVVA